MSSVFFDHQFVEEYPIFKRFKMPHLFYEKKNLQMILTINDLKLSQKN